MFVTRPCPHQDLWARAEVAAPAVGVPREVVAILGSDQDAGLLVNGAQEALPLVRAVGEGVAARVAAAKLRAGLQVGYHLDAQELQ